MSGIVLILCLTWLVTPSQAKDIKTNEVIMLNAPDWVKQPRVEHVIDHIQLHLKPTGQKVTVTWYNTQEDYDKVQSFGAMSLAVTKYTGGTPSVHIGPQVDEKNFEDTFGHELVHVIVFQRYHDALPKWLEEGMANYYSSKEKVDYKWLASQPFPDDVHGLAHPFTASSPAQIIYRYKASQAFCEMLAKKCDLDQLISMSASEDKKRMEDYMVRSCGIQDLNQAFRDWVKKKAGPGTTPVASR